VAAGGCLIGTARASASTEVTLQASFAPDRLGASTALTVGLRFFGGTEGVPAPLRSVVLHLPAGLGVALRGTGRCAAARVRRHGAGGCPGGALLGRGHARLQVHAGSQTIPEQAALWAFLGPSSAAGAPTIAILGEGSTPLDERTVSTGVVHADSAPFGSKVTVTVPPIPTVMLEPDASVDSLSLTVGAAGNAAGRTLAARITVPRRCPRGGFPFAVQIGFADGSRTEATAAVRCP
jgi:hypothetical protein